jgi:hypothetical protein
VRFEPNASCLRALRASVVRRQERDRHRQEQDSHHSLHHRAVGRMYTEFGGYKRAEEGPADKEAAGTERERVKAARRGAGGPADK